MTQFILPNPISQQRFRVGPLISPGSPLASSQRHIVLLRALTRRHSANSLGEVTLAELLGGVPGPGLARVVVLHLN